MPATAEVHENGHILKYVISDPWTMDDIVRITRQGKRIYDSSRHNVHLIVDVTRTNKAPRGFMSVRNMPDLNHTNSGHITVVGATGVIRAMVELVAHFFPADTISYFETEADALAYLYSLIAAEAGG